MGFADLFTFFRENDQELLGTKKYDDVSTGVLVEIASEAQPLSGSFCVTEKSLGAQKYS